MPTTKPSRPQADLGGLQPSREARSIQLAGVADLQDLVNMARDWLEARGKAASCGVTVDAGHGLTETLAATDDRPIRVDWLQRELRQGPRSGPGWDAPMVVSADLATDPRWPEFGPLCAQVIGVQSLLSVHVPQLTSPRAVINLCAEAPGVFGEQDAVLASQLALDLGILALADRVRLEVDRTDPAAVENRLAEAIDILMSRYRVKAGDAFFMLDKSSRDLGVSLLELAVEVGLSGRLPARRISQARAKAGDSASAD